MRVIISNLRLNRLALLTVVIVLSAALTCNLETIRTFPSWFDEAFMANISFNLAQGDGLTLDLIPGLYDEEVKIYGPVYFVVQAKLIDLFGLHELVFRLPNFLSSYLSIFLIALTLKLHGVPRHWWLGFLLLASLDISINRNLVSGRMDMLAVLFVALALFFASCRFKAAQVAPLAWLLIGGFSALAFLTTPRALFLLPVVGVVALGHFFREAESRGKTKIALGLAISLLAFSVPVVWWIREVGGFTRYAAMFADAPGVSQHIAPSFFRSSYDNLSIGLMLAIAAVNARQVIQSHLISGLMLTYLSFSLFVKEVGPYAGMIMPFVLASIVALLNVSQWQPSLKFGVAVTICLPGMLVLSLRSADLALNSTCRDHARLQPVLERTIEENNNLVAPFKYYFFVESPSRDLETFQYSEVDRNFMLNKAEVVVADRDAKEIIARGFKPAADLTCSQSFTTLLPRTFVLRSTFDEFVYVRQP